MRPSFPLSTSRAKQNRMRDCQLFRDRFSIGFSRDISSLSDGKDSVSSTLKVFLVIFDQSKKKRKKTTFGKPHSAFENCLLYTLTEHRLLIQPLAILWGVACKEGKEKEKSSRGRKTKLYGSSSGG